MVWLGVGRRRGEWNWQAQCASTAHHSHAAPSTLSPLSREMSMRPIVLLVLALATTKTNAYRTCLRSLTRESSVHRVTVHTWRHTHQVTLQAGGPPPGVQSGGPPPGVQTGGPPGSGPPAGGGPPKGGPPPRTLAQKVVDAIFEAAFPLLYAFEDGGMLDSEKNLRVLWVRALLAAAGELNDDRAHDADMATGRMFNVSRVGPATDDTDAPPSEPPVA